MPRAVIFCTRLVSWQRVRTRGKGYDPSLLAYIF